MTRKDFSIIYRMELIKHLDTLHITYILDSERAAECIDFSMVCDNPFIFYFLAEDTFPRKKISDNQLLW